MANDTEPGKTRQQWYEDIRDEMRANVAAERENVDSLPVGVRGLAKLWYGIFNSIVIPAIALVTSISQNNQENQEIWLDRPAGKAKVSRDRDWWINVLKAFGYKDDTINALQALIPDNIPGPGIVHFAYVAFFVAQQIATLSRVISSDTYKELSKRFHPAVPNAESILKAAFIAPELDDSVKEHLRQGGLSEEAIKLLYVSNYQLQSFEQIRSIYFREGKSEEWLNNRLLEAGFTPERIGELKSIMPVIPGIQDLIMFQAHEQFEPDLIAKFGLWSEEPSEIYEWTRKLGLSDEWTLKYWGGHWIHPAYNQVMEMLHRGIIEETDVWEWFKLVEIPPYWRQKLMDISYVPFTRVDIRRMHDMGVVSDEDVVKNQMSLGYSREYAELYLQWVVKYNLDNDKEISRSDILKGYEDGDLTESEAVMLLKQIGYREDHAYYLTWQIDNEKTRAARLDYIEYVKAQFLSHLIPENEARSNLLGAGLGQSRVGELIVKWKTVQISNTKLPSKTDLDKMLRAGVIGKERYYQEMGFLGYRKGYVDLYYEMATKGEA